MKVVVRTLAMMMMNKDNDDVEENDIYEEDDKDNEYHYDNDDDSDKHNNNDDANEKETFNDHDLGHEYTNGNEHDDVVSYLRKGHVLRRLILVVDSQELGSSSRPPVIPLHMNLL